MRNIILILLTLTFASYVNAEELERKITETKYKVSMEKATQQYRFDSAACNKITSSTNKICNIKADGQRKVTEAYLNARLNPTLENNVNARIVLANTTYETEVEMCDSKSEKQVCINAANLIKDQAIANARAFTNPSDLYYFIPFIK